MILTCSPDNTARIWNTESGRLKMILKGHKSGPLGYTYKNGKLVIGRSSGLRSASFSPDGQKVVTSSWDNTAKIWDAHIGTQLMSLEGHTSGSNSASVNCANFSPDGLRVVTGGSDSTVKIWDESSGKELLSLGGHIRYLTSASFSPDGLKIIACSNHTDAKIYEAVNWSMSKEQFLTKKKKKYAEWVINYSKR